MAVSASTSIYKVLLALSFTLVIILWLAVYVSSRKRRAQSPTVETPVLKVAAVEFESGGPKYDVIVWNRTKFSTDMFDMQEISQSRIEVKSGDDEYRFEWPDKSSCAPESAELRDLTGTGSTVLLLSCTPITELRVVQFRDKHFIFRSDLDRLPWADHPHFMDFNKGHPQFVVYLNFPQKFGDPNNYETLPLPVVYRWSPEKGFEDVSAHFPDFYQNTAIPELRKEQQAESNGTRRKLFDHAIDYIEHSLSSKSGVIPR